MKILILCCIVLGLAVIVMTLIRGTWHIFRIKKPEIVFGNLTGSGLPYDYVMQHPDQFPLSKPGGMGGFFSSEVDPILTSASGGNSDGKSYYGYGGYVLDKNDK